MHFFFYMDAHQHTEHSPCQTPFRTEAPSIIANCTPNVTMKSVEVGRICVATGESMLIETRKKKRQTMEAGLPLLLLILLVLLLYMERKLLTMEGGSLLEWFDSTFWRPVVVKDTNRLPFYDTSKTKWCAVIRANWKTIWEEYKQNKVHLQPTSDV